MTDLNPEECYGHPLFAHLGKTLNTTLWELLDILGDFLEENGQPELAQAYHLFGVRSLIPYFRLGSWCWMQNRSSAFKTNYILQSSWMDALKRMRSPTVERWYAFDTLHEAYWHAALAYVDAGLSLPLRTRKKGRASSGE